MDYATGHGNSYVDRERETVEVFFKEKPAHLVALICRYETPLLWLWSTVIC